MLFGTFAMLGVTGGLVVLTGVSVLSALALARKTTRMTFDLPEEWR